MSPAEQLQVRLIIDVGVTTMLDAVLLGLADHSQYFKDIAAQPEHLGALLKVHNNSADV